MITFRMSPGTETRETTVFTKSDLVFAMAEKHISDYDMERVLKEADSDDKIKAAIKMVSEDYGSYDIARVLKAM